ncbi:hypothetical protein [Haliangium ochraceum]|uniref:hypothetical protein n=1 Tax=Haliangium ochraceum TaxID=80816 RepID=UPI001269DC6F|nr:hypothetical protein [Haliangium ochraceum]
MSPCLKVKRGHRRSLLPRRGNTSFGMALLSSLLIIASLGACHLDEAQSSAWDVGQVQHEIQAENRLALNRLALNRLALNRLALNRLALNEISSDDLEMDPALDILATVEGREVLAYVVQCALGEDTSLIAETADGSFVFHGLLGLEPDWVEEPLDLAGQRSVSACLLARVNAFGESVPLSLRLPGRLPSTAQERASYKVYEGSFFGQVFEEDGGEQKFYACQGSIPETSMANSATRPLRVCTDDTSGCEIAVVGRCRDVCETRSDDAGWQDCWAEGVRYEDTVSVYLETSNPDNANWTCSSWYCLAWASEGRAAILDCGQNFDCDSVCRDNAVCTIDGAFTGNFGAYVTNGSIAEIDCAGADDCGLLCEGGSTCDLDCSGIDDCRATCKGGALCEITCEGDDCEEIECIGGASCLLHCKAGDDDCEFDRCAGGLTECPGNVLACNRGCP